QFAKIDEGFLAWDFNIKDESDLNFASVNRNFIGFAREIFTDTGEYAIRMRSSDLTHSKRHTLPLDKRALILACAINVDIDYFSRHSNSTSGWGFPLPFIWGGGGEQPAASGDTGGIVAAPDNVAGSGVGIVPPPFIPGQNTSSSTIGDSGASNVGSGFGGTENTNGWGDSPFLSDDEAEKMAGIDRDGMTDEGMVGEDGFQSLKDTVGEIFKGFWEE
ncbi:hypothetical protein HK096_000629, partial [Nowakowskiella sp. JEL0078]